ncbi:MAG: restriction endonuclease subunit S [Bacteroidia bacterium]|nr:restriction endonuclease subunit S [Bacteroidia bacterium]
MTDEQNPRHYLVPRLRFPEFLDAGEWEKKMLGEIADSITERAADRKLTLFSITSGIGLVSQIDKFGKEIAGKQYKNYYVIKNGDFAYNKSATKEYPEGFIAMYSGADDGAVPNSVFTCFRVRNECANPKYLNYLFAKNLHGKWLKKVISVGARAHGSLNVDDKDLFSIPLPFPGKLSFIPEQQKIAECLSTLDELITAHSRKLAALKKYKQGLLQQLFPRPGETVPRLRFPEFEGAGEWEEVLMSQVCDFQSGFPFPSSGFNDERIGIRLARNRDLKFDDSVVFFSLEYSLEFLINDGDLLVGMDGEFIPIVWSKGKALLNQRVGRIHSKSAHKRFLLYALARVLSKIEEETGRTTVVHLSATTFLQSTALFPSIPEQQKIAECLSSIDELITAQAQEIEALKAHKQGLLQQLFPVAATAQA